MDVYAVMEPVKEDVQGRGARREHTAPPPAVVLRQNHSFTS